MMKPAFGLALVLGVLPGCDSAVDPGGACLPDDGCDGIAEITDRVSSDPTGAAVSGGGGVDEAPVCAPSDDPRVTYVAEDTEVCGEVDVQCEAGWSSIASDCGCGCIYTDDTVSEDVTFRSGAGGGISHCFVFPESC